MLYTKDGQPWATCTTILERTRARAHVQPTRDLRCARATYARLACMHARACPYHNVSGLVKTTLRPGHTHPHPRNIPLSCFRHVEMRVVRWLLAHAGIELFSLINHLLWYRLQTTAYPHRLFCTNYFSLKYTSALSSLFAWTVYFGVVIVCLLSHVQRRSSTHLKARMFL